MKLKADFTQVPREPGRRIEFMDDPYIETMLEECAEVFPENEFIESLSEAWELYGRLTIRQYEELLKVHDRV